MTNEELKDKDLNKVSGGEDIELNEDGKPIIHRFDHCHFEGHYNRCVSPGFTPTNTCLSCSHNPDRRAKVSICDYPVNHN